MVLLQLLQVDRELDIRRGHNILNLEFFVSDLKPHFLDDSREFTTGQATVFLGLSSSYNHFATTKNQPSGLRVSESHDYSGKSIGIVLSGLTFPRDFLEIKFAVQINSANDVLHFGKSLLRNFLVPHLLLLGWMGRGIQLLQKSVMKETVEKQPEVDLKKQASYTYWVDNKNKSRELPPEQKPQKVEVPLQKENSTHKSVWNTCGTWEEKKIPLADLKAQYEPKILAWIEETGVTFKFESLTLDGDCHLVSKRHKVSLMYDLNGCISFTGTGKKCQFSIEELTDHGDRTYSIKADNAEEKQTLSKNANSLITMLEEILSLYKQTE